MDFAKLLQKTFKRMNGQNEMGFSVDAVHKVVWRNGEIVDIPPKAVEMLLVLLRNRGRVVSKDELLSEVWGDTFVEESVLSNNVYLLRKALGGSQSGKDIIRTIPRRGYKLEENWNVGGSEFVLEHHVFEQTVIEQDMSFAQTTRPQLAAATKWSRTHIYLLVGVLVLASVVSITAWTWWRSPDERKGRSIETIAVIPVRSLTGTEDSNLRLRLTDALITRLARNQALTVRSTDAITKFVDSELSATEIGKQLAVDAVLTGTTQQEKGVVRLNLQLVRTDTGSQVWSETFDGRSDRLLAFQDAVGSRIALFFGSDGPDQQRTMNPLAFEQYQLGRYFLMRSTPDSLKTAAIAFKTATEIDPDFADAYAGLSDTYLQQVDFGYVPRDGTLELAKVMSGKALSIDPSNSNAFVIRASIAGTYEHEWKTAEEMFQKAIMADPHSANAQFRYGVLLMKLSRFDEAERQLDAARSLSPTSPALNTNLGVVRLFSGKLDAAESQLSHATSLQPTFSGPHWWLSRYYRAKGDNARFFAKAAAAMRLDGDDVTATILDSSGISDDTKLERWYDSWQSKHGTDLVNAHDLALVAAYKGDVEQTLKWLERSVSEKHPWATWIKIEPEFQFLRNDPRFKRLIDELRLSN